MPFLELHLDLKQSEQVAVEACLDALGALSVTLLDAEDSPIYEPGVGETPLWPTIHLAALYPAETDHVDLLVSLDPLVPKSVLDSARFAQIDDRDWTRAWMDTWQPMRFGQKLWIYPSLFEVPADLDGTVVRLDPGMAFGTGTHPTTAMCLEWIDGLAWAGETLVDFGCGSGILAIAALKLGAAHAYAIDNDPQALTATRENARRNGVADRLTVLGVDEPLPPPQGRLLANILLGPLLSLAPQLSARVLPGGLAVFSGMLADQADDFLTRYQAQFADLHVRQQGDWIAIDGLRKP